MNSPLMLVLLLACTTDKSGSRSETGDDGSTGATDTGCVPITELCNALDDDCDGIVDNVVAWVDSDGDGYGAPDYGELAYDCENPPEYLVFNTDDCDDTDAAVNPDSIWYTDADGDGFGAGADTVACDPGEGWALQAGDCDDSRAWVFPGATELCDGLDDDCDDQVDEDAEVVAWATDADGDGFGDADAAVETCEPADDAVPDVTDCDDDDGSVFPGAQETCSDGIDQDCSGVADNGCTELALEDLVLVRIETTFSGGDPVRLLDLDADSAFDVVVGIEAGDELARVFPSPFAVGEHRTDADGVVLTIDTPYDHDTEVHGMVDVDGDGFGDLVLVPDATFTEGDAVVSMLTGPVPLDGSTLFPQAIFPADQYGTVAGGDVTGDGVADLVTLDEVYSPADGTTVTEGWWSGAWNYRCSSEADLDGDGVHDQYCTSGSTLEARYGPFLGVLSDEIELTLDTGADRTHGYGDIKSVAAGDLDGDGHVDLAVGTYHDPGKWTAGVVHILHGEAVRPAQPVSGLDLPWIAGGSGHRVGQDVWVSDGDGDGDHDLVAWRSAASSGGEDAALLVFAGHLRHRMVWEDADVVVIGAADWLSDPDAGAAGDWWVRADNQVLLVGGLWD